MTAVDEDKITTYEFYEGLKKIVTMMESQVEIPKQQNVFETYDPKIKMPVLPER